MSPFVGENTLILSLMNGISSEERLADGLKNTLIGGSHSDV
jgi:ketopantoate reductase